MKLFTIQLLAVVLITTLFFSSCFSSRPSVYGADHYTRVGPTSSEFYTFHLGENINFEYQYLNFVSAVGGEFSNSSEVLIYLKQKAWSYGANALINLEIYQSEKFFGDCDEDGNKIYKTVSAAKGLAVKAVLDDEFRQIHGSRNDLSFVGQYDSIVERQNETDATMRFFGVIGLVGFGIWATYIIAEE